LNVQTHRQITDLKTMNGHHTRMYRDFLIEIALLRDGEDLASLSITTRSLADGSAGPEKRFSLKADQNVLTTATNRIRQAIDLWIGGKPAEALNTL
jgi:hypothetical protein